MDRWASVWGLGNLMIAWRRRGRKEKPVLSDSGAKSAKLVDSCAQLNVLKFLSQRETSRWRKRRRRKARRRTLLLSMSVNDSKLRSRKGRSVREKCVLRCSSSADFSAIGFSSVQCWSSSVVLWPATVLLICIYIRIFTVWASTTAAQQQHWLAPAAVYEQQWPSRPFPLPSIEACLCPGALHCTTGSGGEGGEQAVAICYVLAKRTKEEEGWTSSNRKLFVRSDSSLSLSNWSLKLLLLVTPASVLLMIRRERERKGNGFSDGEKHHRYCKDLAAAAATPSSLPKAFSRLCRCCCCGGGSSGKVLWKCWNSTDKRGVVAVPAAAAIDAAVCSALHPLLSPLFLFLHRRRRS